MADVAPSQRRFIEMTSQPWEREMLGIPFTPVREIWGSPFAGPPFAGGGHIVVTTSRFVLCPRQSPVAWAFHFDELVSVSINAKLMQARLSWVLADSGAEVRWDTLRKGGLLAVDAWRKWRELGSAINHYQEVGIERADAERRCGYCHLAIDGKLGEAKRCPACGSLLHWPARPGGPATSTLETEGVPFDRMTIEENDQVRDSFTDSMMESVESGLASVGIVDGERTSQLRDALSALAWHAITTGDANVIPTLEQVCRGYEINIDTETSLATWGDYMLTMVANVAEIRDRLLRALEPELERKLSLLALGQMDVLQAGPRMAEVMDAIKQAAAREANSK